MSDIEKFSELVNKMVSLLPWKLWPSEFEILKNDSLASIIEIMCLKPIFLNGYLYLFVNTNNFH